LSIVDIEDHQPEQEWAADQAAAPAATRRPTRPARKNRRQRTLQLIKQKPDQACWHCGLGGPYRLVQLGTNHANTSTTVALRLSILNETLGILESADERHRRNLRQAHADTLRVLTLRDAATKPPFLPRGLRPDVDTWAGGKWLPAHVATWTICRGRSKELKELNRRMTSWPSLKTDLKNAGANWVDQEVVVDQGLVTSRSPDDIPAFSREVSKLFSTAPGCRRAA
jgi:hypothetical protein